MRRVGVFTGSTESDAFVQPMVAAFSGVLAKLGCTESGHHDGDRPCRGASGHYAGRRSGHDKVGLARDECGGQNRQTRGHTIGAVKFQPDVAAFNVTKLAQAWSQRLIDTRPQSGGLRSQDIDQRPAGYRLRASSQYVARAIHLKPNRRPQPRGRIGLGRCLSIPGSAGAMAGDGGPKKSTSDDGLVRRQNRYDDLSGRGDHEAVGIFRYSGQRSRGANRRVRNRRCR